MNSLIDTATKKFHKTGWSGLSEKEYQALCKDRVYYEWKVEHLTDDEEDIEDCTHYVTYAECLNNKTEHSQICLVRNVGNEFDGVKYRSHAYVIDGGILPDVFDDGNKVPMKYIREVEAHS